MVFDYRAYVETYNRHDAKPDDSSHFTEDVIMETPWGKTEGRANVLERFAGIAKYAKEELRPIHVVSEGNLVMAEVDACFMPHEDWNGGFHEFKKGQAKAFRFIGVYELRGDKIFKVRLSFWPTPWDIPAF